MIYSILIGDYKLGTTKFEKADAPMGVVFGNIVFEDKNIGYNYIKDYCISNEIDLVSDFPKDKVISTRTIHKLKIINESGIEIKYIGNQISGMDEDKFEISLEGVPYPFYEKEFPHHVKHYNEMFK
jgi:hypothetical protein